MKHFTLNQNAGRTTPKHFGRTLCDTIPKAPFKTSLTLVGLKPVSAARAVFNANNSDSYTRVQFMKDCESAGLKKSLAAHNWLAFGGGRDLRYDKRSA